MVFDCQHQGETFFQPPCEGNITPSGGLNLEGICLIFVITDAKGKIYLLFTCADEREVTQAHQRLDNQGLLPEEVKMEFMVKLILAFVAK